jgi:aminopeptidase N
VGTEDFKLAMEQESGLNLERFFERWIYSSSLPQAAFSYRVEPRGDRQVVVLRFEQTGDIFDMPALVTLAYADGRSTDVIVRIDDRVVERTIELAGPLRAATISKRDVTLADFREK